MQLHQLKPVARVRKGQRVGRGGKRGTTSGRGTKGQKARAGHKIRPALRDIIKKFPKRRGRGKHSFRPFRAGPAVLNLSLLEKHFSNGDIVSPEALQKKNLVRTMKGRMPAIKVLATGELKKKFTLKGLSVSSAARAKIEAAGGSISQ